MYRIGIDLGGTNIAVGVVDDRHNIIAEHRHRLPRHLRQRGRCGGACL